MKLCNGCQHHCNNRHVVNNDNRIFEETLITTINKEYKCSLVPTPHYCRVDAVDYDKKIIFEIKDSRKYQVDDSIGWSPNGWGLLIRKIRDAEQWHEYIKCLLYVFGDGTYAISYDQIARAIRKCEKEYGFDVYSKHKHVPCIQPPRHGYESDGPVIYIHKSKFRKFLDWPEGYNYV
jgi:hypothetical protein